MRLDAPGLGLLYALAPGPPCVPAACIAPFPIAVAVSSKIWPELFSSVCVWGGAPSEFDHPGLGRVCAVRAAARDARPRGERA